MLLSGAGDVPAPLAMTALPPLSSLAYRGAASATIAAGDNDEYTIELAAGQSLAVTADPRSATQRLRMDVLDAEQNLIGQASSAGDGQTAMLRRAAVHPAGQYTIVITDLSGESGDYTTQATVNANLELESSGGLSNNSLATAQDITHSFDPIGGAELATFVGRGDGHVVYGVTQRISGQMFAGNVMNFTFPGTPTATSGATLIITARGDLGFVTKYLTIDIGNGVVVQDVFVNDGATNIDVTTTINLTAQQLNAAIVDDTVPIKVTPSSSVANNGGNYVELHVAYGTEGTTDLYRIDLAEGERLDAMLTPHEPGNFRVDLLDSAGDFFAAGSIGAQTQAASLHDVAPPAGTYYLRVIGPIAPYTLTASRSATLHAERREGLDITVSGAALGELTMDGLLFDDFTFAAAVGDPLVIETSLPGGALNLLDLKLELRGPDGALLASDHRGAADGRNARIALTAPATGVYTLTVRGGDEALQPGLLGRYYNSPGELNSMIPADALPLVLTRVDPHIDFFPATNYEFAHTGLSDLFLVNWEGYLLVPESGSYLFSLGSDDGSRLTIDGAVVVNHETSHIFSTRTGTVTLQAGLHPIKVEMYENFGSAGVQLKWRLPNRDSDELVIVPASAYFHGNLETSLQAEGSYIVNLSGHTAPAPPFAVAAITPDEGGYVSQFFSEVKVVFNHDVLGSSIEASDLLIDGVPAVSVSLSDSRTAVFATGTTTAVGAHQITIAAGAVTDTAGRPLATFSSGFTRDVTQPRVLSVSIANGAVLTAGDFSISYQFSEAIDLSVLDDTDIQLINPQAATVSADERSFNPATNTLTLTFRDIFDGNYTLRLQSGAVGRFQDLAGNLLDGGNTGGQNPHDTQFSVDTSIAALRSPFFDSRFNMLARREEIPLILTAGDVDTFTLDLDAGQVISARVRPGTGLRQVIEVYNPQGTPIGSATSDAAGVLTAAQGIPVATAGTYRIVVRGFDAASAGTYTLAVFLNGYQYDDAPLRRVNTSIAAAQNLNSSFVTVAPGVKATNLRHVGPYASSNPADRYYRFSLEAGEKLSVWYGPFQFPSTTNVTLLSSGGASLAVGQAITSSIDRTIQSFTAPATGDYILRFSQVSQFDAFIARNAAINTGNNTIVSATDITATGRALGAVYHNGVDLPTLHKIALAAGQTVTLITATPFDAPLDVLSNLDASLRLLHADGTLLASNDNGAADGRNARIVHTAQADGVYYIRVGAVAGSSGGYLLSAEVANDTAPPTVAAVFADSSAWSDAFRNHLASIGAGGGAGYAIATSPGTQLLPLPWINLNRIALRFSENVQVTATDLSITGVNTADYSSALAAGTFAYDNATFTATWSLPAALTADKLLLSLSTNVTDLAENTLDGDFETDGEFPTGDGQPGGEFAFRFNVLPGDANHDQRVLGNDLILVRNTQFQSAGAAQYNAFFDVDGSATILGSDLIHTRNRQFIELPAGEPVAAMSALMSIQSDEPAPLEVSSSIPGESAGLMTTIAQAKAIPQRRNPLFHALASPSGSLTGNESQWPNDRMSMLELAPATISIEIGKPRRRPWHPPQPLRLGSPT